MTLIGTPVAGTAAANTVAATSLAVPYPTVSAGNLLVLVVGVSNATAPTNPTGAGFTSRVTNNSGGSSPSFRISTKVATGSETGNLSVTTPNSTSQGRMWAISGVDQTNPMHIAGVVDDFGAGVSAYTIDATGATTTVNKVMVFIAAAANAASGTYSPPTAPGTFTEVWDSIATTPSITADYLIWTSSGVVGNINLTRSAGVRGTAGAIFLNPDSGISGTVAGTSDVSGTVALSQPVSGQVDAVSAVTGTVGLVPGTDFATSGQVDATSSTSGTVTALFDAAGTIAAVTAVTGAVEVLQGLSGTVAGTSAVTGDVSLLASVSGTIPIVSSTSAGTITLSASGTVVVVSDVTGAPFMVAPVDGVAVVVSTVAGAVDVIHPEIPVSFRFSSRLRVPAASGDLRARHVVGQLRIPSVEGDIE